jgi:hypothetical protein
MDLSDIDQWSRALLQNEARKRGIRTPEMYSRGELVKLILRHDYGSARSVREAAKLVGGIWGSAKLALRAGLGMTEGRLERDAGARARERTGSPPTAAPEDRREPGPLTESLQPSAAAAVAYAQSESLETTTGFEPARVTPAPTAMPTPRAASPVASTYTSPWDEPPVSSGPDAEAAADDTPAAAQLTAADEPDSAEQLIYGPHPDTGMLLRWRVGADAIQRARAVLGAHGELALRVVTVRVEDGLFVRTETLDHGPIGSVGIWTAPLAPGAARYVSSVGLRSGDRFVSIVHATT